MRKVGGNVTAEFLVGVQTANAIGERVTVWQPVQYVKGWLDFQGESTGYERYNAKIQESTHVFICDNTLLDERIRTSNCRMRVNGEEYDVMAIDDPMGLKYHHEIFLQYRGEQG